MISNENRIEVYIDWAIERLFSVTDVEALVIVRKHPANGRLRGKIKLLVCRDTGRRISPKVLLEPEVEEILERALEEAAERL